MRDSGERVKEKECVREGGVTRRERERKKVRNTCKHVVEREGGYVQIFW